MTPLIQTQYCKKRILPKHPYTNFCESLQCGPTCKQPKILHFMCFYDWRVLPAVPRSVPFCRWAHCSAVQKCQLCDYTATGGRRLPHPLTKVARLCTPHTNFLLFVGPPFSYRDDSARQARLNAHQVLSWLACCVNFSVRGDVLAADGTVAVLPQWVRQAGAAEGMPAGDGKRSFEEHHADWTVQLFYLLLYHQCVINDLYIVNGLFVPELSVYPILKAIKITIMQ